jgi:hypothetical protein
VELLQWIENSAAAEYIRVSAYGYPAMITLHSLGLAIMVGLSVVLSMRILGFFSPIPYTTLHKQLKIAWIGFIVNFISGGMLFAAQATTYVTDFEFILKMTFVIIGAILVAVLQGQVKAGSAGWTASSPPPGLTRALAGLTIVCWICGMITGRLIAYL